MLAVVAAALAMWGAARRWVAPRAIEPRSTERLVRWAMTVSSPSSGGGRPVTHAEYWWCGPGGPKGADGTLGAWGTWAWAARSRPKISWAVDVGWSRMFCRLRPRSVSMF